ncbi:xanthine dehydrogenase family protein molybdopterin-binding subunit [Streptomyces sp. 4N509B]|uniref:xanthine dehydrogenase family protein molybdopterin-binding subunit n=1 Tax=Streptomyces sp. 4N509B TaxID=3457413 RepID=UPI003FD24688
MTPPDARRERHSTRERENTRAREAAPRREDLPFLTGDGRFVGDVRHPGQLWARVVRSPVAHAELLGVDLTRARAAPGVRAALAAEDLRADLGRVPVLPVRLMETDRMRARRQPVLASGRVRYVGEPVALVVAEDPYRAEDAAERVTLRLAGRPPALGGREPPLWDDGADNELVRFTARHGAARALAVPDADAARVVELDLAVGRQTGLPTETRGLVAWWRDDGRLHLWGVTKYVHFTRRSVAAALGVAEDAVVVHRVDVGGMFGVRGELYPEDVLLPWAARLLRRPVGWVEDRREHLTATNHSREQRHRLRLAVAADGRLLTLRDRVVVDLGAYPRPIGGRYARLVQECLPGPYRWRAVDVETVGLASNRTPVGTMRAPLATETTFARERAVDVAARALGVDPVELRLRNLAPPPTEASGVSELRPDSGDPGAVLRAVLDHAGWPALRSRVRERRRAGELAGLGVAVFAEASGAGGEETVELRLDAAGRFVLGTSAAEIGQGLATMAARVLAPRLGVPEEAVAVWSGDSRAHGGGNGTFGSRTTIFVGSAAADAAERMLAALRRRAAGLLGAPPEELLRTAEGFARRDGHAVELARLGPLTVVGRHAAAETAVGVGAHIAVVRVDPDTGQVEVERLVVGYDCGRAVDPESVRAQLVGGAVQGLGGALLEELAYDEHGAALTSPAGPAGYLPPVADAVPDVEALVLELAPATGNPLGARGVGEAGVVGVAAAVANAVADAVGPPGDGLTSLPLTPERVWALLRERPAGGPGAAGPTRPQTKQSLHTQVVDKS